MLQNLLILSQLLSQTSILTLLLQAATRMTVLQAIKGIMVKNRDQDLDPAMSCSRFALIHHDMLFL